MLAVICLTFFSNFILNEGAPTTWKHPGVMVDSNRLVYIASQIAVNNTPMQVAYQKALKSKYGSKTYVPQGPPATGVIECGAYSDPDYGCTAASEDFSAAYLQMILYNLTKDTTYSNNALKILNVYGHNVKLYNNTNAPLQAAWDASKYSRAADLAAHLPGVNWGSTDQQAFKNMFVTVVLPLIYNGSGANGNWELSMIEAMMGMSVFLENATLFDHAVEFWKERTPAYFYNFAQDGSQPVKTPRGTPGWYGQTVFNASTSGHCQETCRDEGHTQFGQAGMIDAAETAYIQGVDLYTPYEDRIITAVEYNNHWDLTPPPPSYICNGTLNTGFCPTHEIVYNAYVNRLGKSLPYTNNFILQKVRTMSDPVNYNIMVYETLTHAGSPK